MWPGSVMETEDGGHVTQAAGRHTAGQPAEGERSVTKPPNDLTLPDSCVMVWRAKGELTWACRGKGNGAACVRGGLGLGVEAAGGHGRWQSDAWW